MFWGVLDPRIGYLPRKVESIKEHRHNKIKNKCINKFKHLYYKRFGYHHNFTRNSQLFDSTYHSLSRQSNVPSNISTIHLEPVTFHQFLPHPWPLHLLHAWTQHPQQQPSTHPPVPGIHVKHV